MAPTDWGDADIFLTEEHKDIFLAHADFCSRRLCRNRRNSLAHFYYFTRNAQNAQNLLALLAPTSAWCEA